LFFIYLKHITVLKLCTVLIFIVHNTNFNCAKVNFKSAI